MISIVAKNLLLVTLLISSVKSFQLIGVSQSSVAQWSTTDNDDNNNKDITLDRRQLVLAGLGAWSLMIPSALAADGDLEMPSPEQAQKVRLRRNASSPRTRLFLRIPFSFFPSEPWSALLQHRGIL